MIEGEKDRAALGARSIRLAAVLSPVDATASARAGSRGRISDLVYRELSEAIRDLRLEPGTPLSEPAVAAELGVSRAPVREAFTRLAEQHLITIVPQVGSRVAPISMQDVSDAVFIRDSLETGAFRRAILSEELDTGELQQVVDRNREAAERKDLDAFFETDERLHQLVFALGGVPHLWEFVRGTKIQLDRLRRLLLRAAAPSPELSREHQRIVDALVARDEAAGAAVIHIHAQRALTDTMRLRAEHPDLFA